MLPDRQWHTLLIRPYTKNSDILLIVLETQTKAQKLNIETLKPAWLRCTVLLTFISIDQNTANLLLNRSKHVTLTIITNPWNKVKVR